MKMGIFEAKSALIERVGWMAPPALRYAVQGCAPLRRRESKWRVRRTTGRRRQIGWRMAFYLRGKISVDTNDPSPKEATEMSRDIKYIEFRTMRSRSRNYRLIRLLAAFRLGIVRTDSVSAELLRYAKSSILTNLSEEST
jgi:hypothetical protein